MNLSDYCDISNKILSKVLIEEAMITANRIFANFLCNKVIIRGSVVFIFISKTSI